MRLSIELLKETDYYRQLLDRKDEQLERNDKLIAGLQERHRDLYQLLHHQTRLLEEAQKTAHEVKNSDFELHREENIPQIAENPGPTRQEIQTVYAVLAAVAFLLTLAIAFHEEIRSLVNG